MRHFLVPMLAASLWLTPSGGKAQHGRDQDGGNKAQGARIAVIDFQYVDTSGEPRDQRKEHEARLEAFMLALKADLAERGGFRLATPLCSPNPCALESSTVNDLLSAARTAGAEILLIGGIHKLSTLVQNAKVKAIDAKTGSVLFDRRFTFRGDTDEAWRRAETFIAAEIADLQPPR